MRKTIKLILMLFFSLVAPSAWSEIKLDDKTIRVQDVQVTNVVEEGTKCPENGRIARNAEGAPLFCQAGAWAMYEPAQRTKWWSGWLGPGMHNLGWWRECQVSSFQTNGSNSAAFDLWGNNAGSSSVQIWTLGLINGANAKVTCYK